MTTAREALDKAINHATNAERWSGEANAEDRSAISAQLALAWATIANTTNAIDRA